MRGRNLIGVLMKWRGSAKEVRRKYKGSAYEVPLKCRGSAKEVPRKCQGSVKKAPRKRREDVKKSRTRQGSAQASQSELEERAHNCLRTRRKHARALLNRGGNATALYEATG